MPAPPVARMVCGALEGEHLVGGLVERVQAQAALAVGRPQLAAGDQVHQRVVLEQRDVGRACAPARSACAARPRRWRRSRARCGVRCGRLRASGAGGRLPARTARPAPAARRWPRARFPPRSGWRPGRTGRRRPPACRPRGRRSCRPSPITAAMPPWAQPLEPSLSARLVSTATRWVGASMQRRAQAGQAAADDQDVEVHGRRRHGWSIRHGVSGRGSGGRSRPAARRWVRRPRPG